MRNRRFTVSALATLALTLLLAPAAASAQSIWDVVRDRARDEDNRRGRRDDDYGRGRGGRLSDHERRQLRDLSRRISDRSRNFQRNLDRLLDDSRYNSSRREDRINDIARDFRNDADRFRGVAGGSNDLYRSQDEARRLLQSASRVENLLRRVRLDSRTANDWSQIRSDLRQVADIYRLRGYDDRGRGGFPWE